MSKNLMNLNNDHHGCPFVTSIDQLLIDQNINSVYYCD